MATTSSVTATKAKTKNSRFAPFIPTLELAPHDKARLALDAEALVVAAIDEYQYYRTGATNWHQWKVERRDDTLCVFRERQSITKNDVDPRTGAPLLPEVMVIGNVSGTVDDMLFGASAWTATAMLGTSRCLDEGLCEAKVLATFTPPSRQDPFRSFSAKWCSFSLGTGMLMGSLRDCTYIETTGVQTLENGEKLGYVLRHSVGFAGMPNLAPFGVVRANIATWAIYRESGPGMVQCFVKSFHDLGAGTWKSKGLKSICDRAVAFCRLGEFAVMKKLALRLQRCSAWETLASTSSSKRSSERSECSVCEAPFALSLLGSSMRQCNICLRAVCPYCLQNKSVCIADEEAQRVQLQQLRVCVTCVEDAHRPTSVQLQVEALVHWQSAKPSLQLLTSSRTDSDGSSDEHI